MTVTLKDRPTRPNELDVLTSAAETLRRYDDAKRQMKALEDELRGLCRDYDLAAGVWGFQPHHLRRACEARGLLP